MSKPSQPLIRIEDVDVALEGRRVLWGLGWCLRPGEHWAVLGRNGSGKSTFLRLIRGDLWPAPGCAGRRVYAFTGEEQTTAVGIKEQIALVSPETQSRYLQQDWTLTALQVIHSGFKAGDYVYQKLSAAQEDAALGLIKLVGVQDLLSRNVQTLSTGELRKVLITRALVGGPRVLVCDEICDGLDSLSRASLLGALERLAARGTQLLYATHRDEELLPVLTHRLRFEQGRIIHCERLALAGVGGRSGGQGVRPHNPSSPDRAHPARSEFERRQNAPWTLRAGKVQYDQGADKAASGQAGLVSGGRLRNPAHRAASNAMRGGLWPSRIRIAVQRASVYHDRREALSGINLEIRAGEHWAVLGPNGAGKTTLLKLIVGDLHPALGGRVHRFEFTCRNTIWEVKRRIGWVSPDLQALYREPLRGAEVIASGFFSSVGLVQKVTRAQWRRVSGIVEALGLRELAERSALQMSYGEFRKILVARALVHRPELLVCDEPFDGLDVSSRGEIARLLTQVASRGTGLIVVTHHPEDLPECTTHVAALRSGRLQFQGPVAAFLDSGLDAL